VVAERLELWNRGLRDGRHLLGRRSRAGEQPEEFALEQRTKLELPVPAGTGKGESLLEGAVGLGEGPRSHQGDRQLEEDVRARGAGPRQQRDSALEQIRSPGHVVAGQRTSARGREQFARLLAQRARVIVERAELVPIAVGLLEVIAAELVPAAVELKPAGE